MTGKWVDNEVYFGPNRRRRELGKRWKDRRHSDDAANSPPLGALLRRLRVILMDAGDPETRGRALQLVRLAVSEAERLQHPEAADALKEAGRQIDALNIPAADARITEAMSLV